jgi:putative CocE/NonD family hydrolase
LADPKSRARDATVAGVAPATGWSGGFRLSRRSLLGGTAAAALTGALGAGTSGAAVSAATPAATTPWARRLWGYIPVPGGAALRYSVLLPGTTGPFPVALQYSGYDSGTIGGSAYLQGDTWLSEDVDLSLLDAGYAVMGLSMRGTGCSSGTFDLFGAGWGSDGATAVEWAASQPWCSGRVAMYDWSYAGLSQLFVAAERPNGLVAIAPGMVVVDALRDVGAPGGVPNVEFPSLWWATILDSWTYDAQNAEGDGDTRGLANLAENLALGQLTSPVLASEHPFEDSFWAERDLLDRIGQINVPVLSMEDWQDEEVGPRGGYYQERLNPDTTWYVGTNGQHDIYVNQRFRSQLIAFLDHFAKGAANGFEDTPKVQLWMDVTSAGAPNASDDELERAQPGWVVELPSLPIPVEAVTLSLGAWGALTTGPPTQSGRPVYVALPGPILNNGVFGAITGGAGGPLSEETWDSVPVLHGGALTFTTAPFTQTVMLSGSASLNLWISSLAPDTDVQATLTEVRPDGQEQYVQRGWLSVVQRAIDPALSTPLRPVHRQTLNALEILEPGVPVEARVEINKFTHVFRPGSSLRLIIDAPSGTGDWTFGAVAGTPNTIWCGPDHPSALVVGLLSTEPAPVGYSAPNTVVGQPCRPNTIPVPRSPMITWPTVTPSR